MLFVDIGSSNLDTSAVLLASDSNKVPSSRRRTLSRDVLSTDGTLVVHSNVAASDYLLLSSSSSSISVAGGGGDARKVISRYHDQNLSVAHPDTADEHPGDDLSSGLFEYGLVYILLLYCKSTTVFSIDIVPAYVRFLLLDGCFQDLWQICKFLRDLLQRCGPIRGLGRKSRENFGLEPYRCKFVASLKMIQKRIRDKGVLQQILQKSSKMLEILKLNIQQQQS